VVGIKGTVKIMSSTHSCCRFKSVELFLLWYTKDDILKNIYFWPYHKKSIGH